MGANALQVAMSLFSEICLLLPTRQRGLPLCCRHPHTQDTLRIFISKGVSFDFITPNFGHPAFIDDRRFPLDSVRELSSLSAVSFVSGTLLELSL